MPEGPKEWEGELKGWNFVIEHIPTGHLEECFRRAIRAKRDSRPICAVDVNTQWADYRMELARIGSTNELKQLLDGRRSPGAGKLLTFTEWVAKHSPSNTEHNEETCAICRHRYVQGQPPISSLTDSGFGGLVGTMTKYEAEVEAKATLDRFREERKAEGWRPLREEAPMFDEETDLSDLPF